MLMLAVPVQVKNSLCKMEALGAVVTSRSLFGFLSSGATFLLIYMTQCSLTVQISSKTFVFTSAYSEIFWASHRHWKLYPYFNFLYIYNFFIAADFFTSGW